MLTRQSNFKEDESKPKIDETENKIKYIPDIYSDIYNKTEPLF